MDQLLHIAAVVEGLPVGAAGVLLFLGVLAGGFIALFLFWLLETHRSLGLMRLSGNPVLEPDPTHWWESQAVFNPGAVVHDGRVHLFYRALGGDGVSRIGHASSGDGIHFDERSPFPVYDWGPSEAARTRSSGGAYRPLSYATDLWASGGGWGGCEDPRSVKIDGAAYMTFGIFEGWQSMRLAVTSLALEDLSKRAWRWSRHIPISPKNERHKNWVLFPEKISGRFAILHALTPSVLINYVDSLERLREAPIQSNNERTGFSKGGWDSFVRGASAPPVKTPYGWLLFYHAMDPAHAPHIGYRVGALLLDLHDPTKILYRATEPVLEPREWYEHDWKPHVVYASGAVLWGDDVIVYYGGGDKRIAAARANLRDFVRKLMHHEHATLTPVRP